MKRFNIEETDNGYIVYMETNLLKHTRRVYEHNRDIDVNIAKKQTMCRLMNDIAKFYSVNGATDDVTVVAQLEEGRPHKGAFTTPKEQKENEESLGCTHDA